MVRSEAVFSRAPGRTTVQRLATKPPRTAGAALARRRFHAARLAERTRALAPRGVGQILDTAADLLAERFGACFGVAAALWFPVLFLESTLFRTGREAEFFLWSTAGGGVVRFVCVAFVCSLVGGELLGRSQASGAALLHAVGRLPGLLVLGAVSGGATMLGMACCLAPAVIPSWLFAVVPAVYVLERVGPLRALRRGVGLMTDGGTFLRWAGCAVVAHLMVLTFLLVQQVLYLEPARARIEELTRVRGPAFDLLVAGVGVPYVALASAFLAVVQTVLYVDVRVRREGLDLELSLEDRERAVSAGAGTA